MRSMHRGVLAVIGIISAFLTLVFLTQALRYLNPALIGSQEAIGMFGIYVIFLYGGVTVTTLSFRPKSTTAKYLAGAGLGLGGLILLTSLLTFSSDSVSAIMLSFFATIQIGIAGGVYIGARVFGSDEAESGEIPDQTVDRKNSEGHTTKSDPASTEDQPTNRTTEATELNKPETETIQSDSSESSKNINWWLAVQIFAGLALFLFGIGVTIQSPLGIPILLIGLALIPTVRRWGMEKLGKSAVE